MKKMILIMLVLYPNFFYAQTYNPQAAADYAREWCKERNTNNWTKSPNNFNITYGNPYNNYPKDCANFVSQCLRAGGLDLSKGINPSSPFLK